VLENELKARLDGLKSDVYVVEKMLDIISTIQALKDRLDSLVEAETSLD
jgi:hypothetical protein